MTDRDVLDDWQPIEQIVAALDTLKVAGYWKVADAIGEYVRERRANLRCAGFRNELLRAHSAHDLRYLAQNVELLAEALGERESRRA